MIDVEAEDALLHLLNSTPVVNGVQEDQLDRVHDAAKGLREQLGVGSEQERLALREARDTLQAVVRGQAGPQVLEPILRGSSYLPAAVTDSGVEWVVDAPAGRRPAVLAVLTWGALQSARPGRLRPCANPECRRFLLDRSKPNKGRWCSMALCGNRMKARRHYQRTLESAAGQEG